MRFFLMCIEMGLVLVGLRADVALVLLDVTSSMYSFDVHQQIALPLKLPTANFALVSGVRILRSAAAALSMRRVVVSAEGGVVAEPSVTDLTVKTGERL